MNKTFPSTAVGLAVAWLSVSGASADTLTVAHGFSPGHLITTQGVEAWTACVEEITNGDVGFNHFPSGQVVSFGTSLDALNEGLSDVSALLVAYNSSKLPLNGITMLPDLGNTSVEMVKAYRKMLESNGSMANEFATNEVRPLLVNLLPAYQIISMKGSIDTVEKFQGLKVRVGGGVMNFTANALGATPVEIGGGDMYVAMQRGTVDGTFLTLSSVKSYSLEELVNAMSSNGAFGSGATVLAMDEGTLGRLSPEHQKAIIDCGLEVEMQLAEYLDSVDEELMAEFAADGITVFEYSEEANVAIADRLEGVANDYISRLQERGLPAQDVYENYREALGK